MTGEKKSQSRKAAIRQKCLNCCCDNKAEVRRCPSTDCPLWIYRMGTEQKFSDNTNKPQEE